MIPATELNPFVSLLSGLLLGAGLVFFLMVKAKRPIPANVDVSVGWHIRLGQVIPHPIDAKKCVDIRILLPDGSAMDFAQTEFIQLMYALIKDAEQVPPKEQLH